VSKCKHKYYHMVKGVLRCTECGQRSGKIGYSDSVPEYPEDEPEEKKAEIPENKMGKKPEDKSVEKIMEPESKRLSNKPPKKFKKK
jgi:hypothetical protein